MTTWFRITAPSATRDIWLTPKAESRPKIFGEPWLLADGETNVYSFLEPWNVDQLRFPVWLAPDNYGKRFGDLLWVGGMSVKPASLRMIDVLQNVGATGYDTFSLDIRDRRGEPIEGYVGFSTRPFPGSDIRHVHDYEHEGFSFVAKGRVVDALHAAGVDKLDIEPYDPSAAPPSHDSLS